MGDTIRTGIRALTGAALLGTIAAQFVGPTATATPVNIYVNNASSAHCSDSGSGFQEQPFCTVSAAAAAVLPGQTVHIAPGQYPEQVNITRSGTADAPISFVGTNGPGSWHSYDQAPVIGRSGNGGTAQAISITGAQHVRVGNLKLAATGEGVHIEKSSDVSVIGASVEGAQSAAARVTGGSDKVTIGKFYIWYSGPGGIVVDGGATNTVVTTNSLTSPGTAISVSNAPGTVVVSNSIRETCLKAIVLSGGSTGATLENNVVGLNDGTGGCSWGQKNAGISVSADSVTGTKADYNVVNTVTGASGYNWGGTDYQRQSDFTGATGQGAHDYFADPNIPIQGDLHAHFLPTVDSADENAPGMLPTDVWGTAPVDDPITPNSGTGSGIRDRGAEEFTQFGTVYTPVTPTRVLDTRSAIGVQTTTPLGFGMLDLQLTGANGLPATGVTAVTLNVTVTQPTSDGFLTVYPTPYGPTQTSDLNWSAGETIANQVTVQVGDGGKISFYRGGGNGTVHVIADLAGYYSAKGNVYTGLQPARALDTRDSGTPVPGNGKMDLQVTGANGVPASGVTAVTLNVTATQPTTDGFLTVYPSDAQRPVASSLNWTAGTTIANLVTVPVSSDGKVSFYAGGGNGTVHVIADVQGYFGAGGHSTYRPQNPDRLVDTRQPSRDFCTGTTRPAGAIPPGGTLVLNLCVQGTTSAMLNVTVTDPAAPGFLTVYPHGQAKPLASNLNWTAGETIPNQVVVPVVDGKVSFYNGSSGSIQLVVDEFGLNMF